MSSYGTWIITGSDKAVTSTDLVAGLQQERSVEVDEWPAAGGWSAGFSVEWIGGGYWSGSAEDIAFLVWFVDELAAAVGGPVAAGWSENGVVCAGCLSGGGEGRPLLLGFNLSDDLAEWLGEDMPEEFSISGWAVPYLNLLKERWGAEDWKAEASPTIAEWLGRIRPGVTPEQVYEVLDEAYGDGGEGLADLMELAGFAYT